MPIRSSLPTKTSSPFSWAAAARALWPYVAIAALCLIVLPSILKPGQLLCTAIDGRHFLVRLGELSWLVDRGVIWPRWGSNLSSGYGYPVFHYYGSLSFYPSLLLHQTGLSLLTSFQAGFWLAFVCSGWAAYAWLNAVTRDRRAALVGAIAYLYLPYHLNTVLYRLNLPEPWALVFPPLVLFGLHRLYERRDGRSVALVALAAAALPLTSNLATMVFAPVLVTYGLLLLLLADRRRRLLAQQLLAALLAFGLAAFFLVPAFVDRGWVQIERGYTPGGLNVFNNFLPLARIFWQPLVADVSRANPLYDPISLGTVIPLFSILVLALAWKRLGRRLRYHALWAIGAALVCILMATPLSAPVYRALDPLAVLQFPWRFVAPATLLVALLAALAYRGSLGRLDRARAGYGAAIVSFVIVLLAWPLLYPGLYCETTPDPSLAQRVASEAGMVGSIWTTAEYLPATVQEVPETVPMYDDYIAGRPVVRWDLSRLPVGARTIEITDTGLKARWEVDTPQPFAAIYRAFFFPGWRAWIDGKPVAIHVQPPHGLIQIPVPAGRHSIAVRFASTPDRIAATGMSIAAALCTLIAILLPAASNQRTVPTTLKSPAWSISAAGLGILLLVVRVALVDPLDEFPRVRRFDGDGIRGVSHTTSITYSAGERLLGYDLLSQPTSAGDPLILDLYWASSAGQRHRGLVRLRDQHGKAWTEWDKIVDFPGLIGPPPPDRWGSQRYTSMRYHVEIPPGTPPGDYDLCVASIDPHTRAPHYVIEGDPLNAERTEAILGQVTVARERTPRAHAMALTDAGRPVSIGPGLHLIRCDVSHHRAQVGETVTLYPLWYAESPPTIEQLDLQLRDAAGRIVWQEPFPLNARYPPAAWQPHDLVRSQLYVLLAPDLASGEYTWMATVADRELVLRNLTVMAPERQYTLPDDLSPVDETLDGFAELVGYRAEPCAARQACSVDLFWRARQETDTSYKAFVHLLNADGQTVVQSDAIPANWTRLTTGWLPPEVIEDTHTLYLPPELKAGQYDLRVGLYEPQTGRRAKTGDGRKALHTGSLTITNP